MNRAKKAGFVSVLQALRRQMTKEFADELVLVTDRDFTRAEALNAERYLSFKRKRKDEHLYAVKTFAQTAIFPKTVGEIVTELGGGADFYRAVFIAIYVGLISADRTQLIDSVTMIHAGDGA
jgi:hypothetical protein